MKILVDKICKRIDGNVILDNVDMEFTDGNIYGFIGRNGSGKTMMMKIICGFVKPTSGNLTIDNMDVFSKGYFNNNIRALIEKPKFIGNLSGFENLKLLASMGGNVSDEVLNYWFSRLNLDTERDKLYCKYSLGMKQKLGIIQALMDDAKIILLDEPFSGIDDASVCVIRDILLEEKKKGKIIVVSTHIREDVDLLCDFVYYFDNGRVSLLD